MSCCLHAAPCNALSFYIAHALLESGNSYKAIAAHEHGRIRSEAIGLDTESGSKPHHRLLVDSNDTPWVPGMHRQDELVRLIARYIDKSSGKLVTERFGTRLQGARRLRGNRFASHEHQRGKPLVFGAARHQCIFIAVSQDAD